MPLMTRRSSTRGRPWDRGKNRAIFAIGCGVRKNTVDISKSNTITGRSVQLRLL